MGSSYYGEPNLQGNDHQRSGGGSSRKGKKSNSDKPKQPQRGLGVAQLEKIRIHSQMGCTYLPAPASFHPHHPYPTNLSPQEDIRLYGASSCVSSSSPTVSYGYQSNLMMGMSELDASNFRYAADTTTQASPRWNPGNGILESQHFAQSSNMTRHFLALQEEESVQVQRKRKKDRSRSMGSSSQNYESTDSQELDLELRLSL